MASSGPAASGGALQEAELTLLQARPRRPLLLGATCCSAPADDRSRRTDDRHDPRDRREGVRAAQARARELGTPITVTVVDEAGRLVLCARGDGTGFFTSRHVARQGRGRRRLPPHDQGDGRGGAGASGCSGTRCLASCPARSCRAPAARRSSSGAASSGRSAAAAAPASRTTSAHWRARPRV